MRIAVQIDQRGLHDGVAGARLVRFGEHVVVAQNVEIAVPVRDQRSQRSAAAVIHVLVSAAVLLGVVIVGIASGGAHLDVARLRRLVLQARAGESGPIQQNVKRRDGVGISGRQPHHKDRRAAGRQGARGSIGCGAVGVGAAGVIALGFADAAVAVAGIDFAPGSGRQRPVDRAGIDLSDLSL